MKLPLSLKAGTRAVMLIRHYLLWLLVFLVAKVIFVLYNGMAGMSAADMFSVWRHGLPLDLSTSAYLTAPVWLGLLITVWFPRAYSRRLWLVYNAVCAVIASLIIVSDTALYSFWNFRIDATIFNYLDNPTLAFASVSTTFIIIGVILTILFAVGISYLLGKGIASSVPLLKKRLSATAAFLLAGGLLFLAIRGGVGRSTANVGMVYFSDKAYLNHSAVNPVFSLISSVGKSERFDKMGRYYTDAERQSLVDELHISTYGTPRYTLLDNARPNVLIILMEGFGAPFIESLGGKPGVAPNFERLAREGVFFTSCYANSFRTDRGTVSALSGYPGFPQTSVMKIPEKTRHMPGIASALAANGYTTSLLYGGDINFTNAQSYFRATGYSDLRSDVHFSLTDRATHAWGVTDSITFDYLFDMIAEKDKAGKPWHIMYQTLASHEPWKVPYSRIEGDEVANAMAYLDHCLGKFVERLRQTPTWQNTLIVCVPDHSIPYPQGLTEADLPRSHIPMLWIGGAVGTPRSIDEICNQSDLPATLLGQMGIDHTAFTFSRDVTAHTYTYPFALHTWNNGLMFIDSTGYTSLDLTSGRTLAAHPTNNSQRRINLAKALLQTQYDDLAGK